MKIGICGTGRMGGAMALRLLDCGHDLTVWNRDRAKLEPLVAAGARVAATPAALLAEAELAITMLLNAEAVAAVYRGADGLIGPGLAGRLIMDMSTLPPSLTAELAQAVEGTGGAFVACPVGGTVGPARSGTLLGLLGGTPDAVARVRPVLDQLCRRVEHVGDAQAAAIMKLAVNLPHLVYWEALGEALALAGSLGLPPERLIDIMADTSGATTGMKGRTAALAAGLGGTLPADPSFALAGARKDLATMLDHAQTRGLELPVVASTLAAYDTAIAAGHADDDAIAVTVARAATGRN